MGAYKKKEVVQSCTGMGLVKNLGALPSKAFRVLKGGGGQKHIDEGEKWQPQGVSV